MQNREDLERRIGRTPAADREGRLFVRWMAYAVAVFFGLTLAGLYFELFAGYAPVLIPSAIPFGIGLWHLNRRTQLQADQQRRNAVTGKGNWLERLFFDRPYQAAAAVIVAAVLIALTATALGGDSGAGRWIVLIAAALIVGPLVFRLRR